MSDIKLVKPHSLPIADAKKIAQKAADDLAKDYGLTSKWQANTLHFQRQGVDGQMQVTPTDIRLDVKLGLLLKPFKGKLLEHVERNFDRLLAEKNGKSAKKTRRA